MPYACARASDVSIWLSSLSGSLVCGSTHVQHVRLCTVSSVLLIVLQVFSSCPYRPGRVCGRSACLGSCRAHRPFAPWAFLAPPRTILRLWQVGHFFRSSQAVPTATDMYVDAQRAWAAREPIRAQCRRPAPPASPSVCELILQLCANYVTHLFAYPKLPPSLPANLLSRDDTRPRL